MTKTTILSLAAAAAFSLPATASDHAISYGGFFSNGYLKSSDYNYLANSKDGDFSFVEAGVNAT